MKSGTLAMTAVLMLSLALVGCGATPVEPAPPAENPAAENPAAENPAAENPAAGSGLAPGLYDQEDGTVIALGTLARVELEGGFWAVLDGTKPEGAEGSTVAVIANGADFADELAALEGVGVEVRGARLEGASIRMAGPEIEMSSILAVDGNPGPAE